jgi:hypothetical protein
MPATPAFGFVQAGRDPEKSSQEVRYVGGCSSLLSQPSTLSVFSGSGWSQSKHRNMREPFRSEGDAKIRDAPQVGHLGRFAWPMTQFCYRSGASSISK